MSERELGLICGKLAELNRRIDKQIELMYGELTELNKQIDKLVKVIDMWMERLTVKLVELAERF